MAPISSVCSEVLNSVVVVVVVGGGDRRGKRWWSYQGTVTPMMPS